MATLRSDTLLSVTTANFALATPAVVGTGRPPATQVRVAAKSCGRDRWTTVPLSFSIDVTHSCGQDSRVHDGPARPL
jgi:hypothetical protein